MAEKRIDIIIGARNATGGTLAAVQAQYASFSRRVSGLGAALAATIGGFSLGEFLRQSVGEFFSAEKAAVELQTALAAMGPAAAASGAGVEMLAQRLQDLTTVEDDQVIALAAMIARLGDLSGPALQQATMATLGLARATGMDQTQAARQYIRALHGTFTTLGRYIPQLQQAKDDTERMAMVNSLAARGLQLMGDEANSAGGAFARFRVALGNIMEVIGSGLAPALEGLSNWFTSNADVIRSWAQAGADAARGLIAWFANMRAALQFDALEITRMFSEMGDTIAAVFDFALERIVTTLRNITTAVRWAFENTATIMNNFIQHFTKLFADLQNFAVGSAMNMVIAVNNVLAGRDISAGMVNTFKPVFDAIVTLTEGTTALVLEGFKETFEVLPSELTKSLREAAGQARNELDRALQATLTRPENGNVAGELGFVGAPATGNDKQRTLGRGGGGGSGRATILGERFLGLADAAASREVELLRKIEKATQQGAKAAEETLDAIGDLTRAIEHSGGDDLPLLA